MRQYEKAAIVFFAGLMCGVLATTYVIHRQMMTKRGQQAIERGEVKAREMGSLLHEIAPNRTK